MARSTDVAIPLKVGLVVKFRNPAYAQIVRMVAGAGSEGLSLEAICARLYPAGWANRMKSVEHMRASARVRIFKINHHILRPLGVEISARTSYANYALRNYNG